MFVIPLELLPHQATLYNFVEQGSGWREDEVIYSEPIHLNQVRIETSHKQFKSTNDELFQANLLMMLNHSNHINIGPLDKVVFNNDEYKVIQADAPIAYATNHWEVYLEIKR